MANPLSSLQTIVGLCGHDLNSSSEDLNCFNFARVGLKRTSNGQMHKHHEVV